MDYFIKRGEEKFGPYNLTELQQYVQSGNIAVDDLAMSEGIAEWTPVSQIVGNIPVAPFGAAAAQEAQAELVPLPPNLHWGWLLLLEALTRNYFNFVWAFVLANWARKLSKNNKPLVLVAMYPAGVIAGLLAMTTKTQPGQIMGVLLILAGLVAYVIGIFNIRDAMVDYYNSTEKYGLKLGAVMTFFFSTLYLQYHINKIARWKKTGERS